MVIVYNTIIMVIVMVIWLLLCLQYYYVLWLSLSKAVLLNVENVIYHHECVFNNKW